jgi:hypothetical protein
MTLRTEQTEAAKEFQETARKTNEAVNGERRRGESAVSGLRVQLEVLVAGGLHVQMLGVSWLVVGVVPSDNPGRDRGCVAIPRVFTPATPEEAQASLIPEEEPNEEDAEAIHPKEAF